MLRKQGSEATSAIDALLRDTPPWKVVLGTTGVTFSAAFVYSQLNQRVPFMTRLKKSIFRMARLLPMVRKQVETEMIKVKAGFEKELLEPVGHLSDLVSLPQKGLSKEEVIAKTKLYMDVGEFDWKKGSHSGTVYYGSSDLTDLMTEVYGMALWSNPLHPDAFPGVRKMEAEVVRMACDLFDGGKDSCGCVTSGGTESIILAMKAYRNYAREVKGIENPVIVCPFSAHAAFDKAADILGIGIRHVRVDPETQKVDIAAMKRAICGRTCVLVGSAPQFAHGSIDNIEEIARLGLKYNIPVHIDACLGGFVIAFMKEAGYPLAPFDFSVPGVTSISADTHKYGYAAKGTSVVLYSSPEYRHYQWFTVPDWPGGIYATATISGSRAGGLIADCWAALIYYGRDGYVQKVKDIISTTKYIEKELRRVEGIKIVGDPQVCIVAIGSEIFNIYALSDEMKKRGWALNALQFPSCIHLCVTMVHTQNGVAERFVSDVREITMKIVAEPDKYVGGSAAIYGMAQSIPDRSIIDEMTWLYLDTLYAVKEH